MVRRPEIIVAIALYLGCVHQVVAIQDVPVGSNDTKEIYTSFLKNWMGKEKGSVNVAMRSEAPSADDLKDFSECARQIKADDLHWLSAKRTDDLTNSVGLLPHVRFIDPAKWKPQDPGELIAHGKSVEAAVQSGFAYGLLTLSTITFDASQEVAAFTYSFVCGALCGNGGSVIFTKSPTGWVRSEHQCGGWIS